jgi:predicted phosphodiesterase
VARVKSSLTRIFSDLHYADRASTLKSLSGLNPLFEGADQVVLNGDTFDTRPSPSPALTEELKREVSDFFVRHAPPAVFLTGNHDPDISEHHALEIADRQVLVTHGDILFEDMVPWSRDATLLRRRISEELARLPESKRDVFESRLIAFRRAAITIPQRHQSEKNGLKYTLGFLADTVWPPTRVLEVLRAWRDAPALADALVARNKFPAKFFVMGHTHRVGARRSPSGLTLINTGSFCPPTGAGVVDVTAERVILRRIERRGSEFRLGASLAEFALARG